MTETQVTARAAGRAGQPYRKGYLAPSHLRDAIAAAHRTRTWWTVCCAVADHMVAGGLAMAVAWVWLDVSPLAGLFLALPLSAGIARQLRALENLVHEASHYNWNRHHRRLNDALGYLLAGFPTGQKLRHYRSSHLLHHGQFGTPLDPDRRRYQELGIESISRDGAAGFAAAITARLVRYQAGWLRELRSDTVTLLTPVVWSAAAVGFPAALLMGAAGGMVAGWAWLAALLVVLPIIRFVAETDEHVYSGSSTVFDATVTNLGRLQRLVFHPHADGFHTVHHMWPGIPHHALAGVHRLLVAENTEFAARVRTRYRVLCDPSPVRRLP